MGNSKILVLHPDARGIDAVVATANSQHAKNGPFDAAVFLGTQIGETAPTTTPEVPIYFFGSGGGSLEDIAPNFTSICKRWAVVRLPSGVTMGFWNEREARAETTDTPPETTASPTRLGPKSSQYSQTPLQQVDVLFSHHWPYAVAATQLLALVGNREVDRVVQECRPRYHLAAGLTTGRFHEHGVFEWSSGRTCRFVSLGRQNSGQRWFYAFSIGQEETGVATAPNPFRKRELEVSGQAETPDQVVTSGGEDHVGADPDSAPLQRLATPTTQAPRAPAKRPRVSPQSCFFCLSNPRFETHMVVAVGKHSYVATAKGPLPRPDKNLRMAGHAIVIPIAHEPTLSTDSDTAGEIGLFQKLLAAAFLAQDMATVFYDIARPDNVHYHMQMVPVPVAAVQTHFPSVLDERVRENDRFERNAPLRFEKYTDGDAKLAEVLASAHYMRFTLYTGGEPVHYVSRLSADKSADLQFPRRVLAFLLRTPRRVHWEKCRQTVAQETYECEKFKAFYGEHDITEAKEQQKEINKEAPVSQSEPHA